MSMCNNGEKTFPFSPLKTIGLLPWPTAGLMDILEWCLTKSEGRSAEAQVKSGFQDRRSSPFLGARRMGCADRPSSERSRECSSQMGEGGQFRSGTGLPGLGQHKLQQ